MACVRKRRGKWVADWRDQAGIRKWRTFDTRREAEDFLDIERPKSRQWLQPSVAAKATLSEYAGHWLSLIPSTVKPRTVHGYRKLLEQHLTPTFGTVPVRQLHRGHIKTFLAAKLVAGLSRNTVRNIYAVLRSLLRSAVDDGLLVSNPADALGHHLRLVTATQTRQETIKAMTADQRRSFLKMAQAKEPRWYPLFFTLAGTGMRLGEALALQWADFDSGARTLRIARAFSKGVLQTPKSGHGRTVDLSRSLVEALLAHRVERATTWVFQTRSGAPIEPGNVWRAMARILKAAGLPPHFSPHSLRHTYASLMLQAGESPAYVQRQLGHASIQLTVDTYGKWLPMSNQGAVDRLDAPGSKTVAIPSSESS